MKIKLFSYKGPVMVNDNCIDNSWSVETSAFDRRDAYNRLVMKVRNIMIDSLDMNAKITLPGRLVEVKL